MDQSPSTAASGSSAGGSSAASTGPASDPATGPGTGPSTPSASASPVDTAGTPDDRASGDTATGAGAGDVTAAGGDDVDDGGAGAKTSGGADATVTRADAPDPDDADDEPGAARAHRPGGDGEDDDAERESDADRERRLQEFAQEHDPERHDIAAGEQFRQRGDWTADEAGGEQRWDADGNLVEGSSPTVPGSQEGAGGGDSTGDTAHAHTGGGATTSGRGTSSYEEVRDGGYSVGSAAPLEDGAMPMGHPVQGWEGSKSYASPGDRHYDDSEPHVWFTDEDAAERAGFRRA